MINLYLSLNIDGTYGFKDNSNQILTADVEIADEIYNKFFEMQSLGKIYKVKDINGATFEDIFEEILPVPISQADLIKSQLAELDNVLPRCMEDIINTLGMNTTKLPQIMQDRLKQKQDLRAQLQTLNSGGVA